MPQTVCSFVGDEFRVDPFQAGHPSLILNFAGCGSNPVLYLDLCLVATQ